MDFSSAFLSVNQYPQRRSGKESGLKKYLLGGDVQPTVGDGLGIVIAPPVQRTPSTESNSRQGSPQSAISQESGPPKTSEAAFQKALQTLRDPPIKAQTPSGTRAPRASFATDIAPSLHFPRSPSPEVASLASPRIEVLDEQQAEKRIEKEKISWQDLDIPEELGIVEDDVPKEIRVIIQDTIEMHRAMRISRIQSRVDDEVVADTLEALSVQDSNVKAESSSMASARSSRSLPASEYTERQNSEFSISQESVTTVGSDNGGGPLLQPPKATGGRPKSLRRLSKSKSDQIGTLSPDSAMARVEARFIESKDRTSRSRGLYNLLKGRKSKYISGLVVSKPEQLPCECTSCFDDVPHTDAIDGLPCRHRYCQPCFTQLVNTSIHNEDTFPPKCCLTDIPKTVMRKYLAPTELAKFDQKSLEYAVPLANRYYCVAPGCARWIDTRIAKRTNGALECPHCETKLCTVCRGPQHPGNQDCPQDFALDATLEQADQSGWRRCHNCRAIVELNTGCRHITCKCRAEFCYTCGAVWRTCQCTEADQRRREQELSAARVQRDAEARAEEEEVRRAIAAVEEAERLLREEREIEEAREQERLQREAEELTQREFERVERIRERFAELRAILDHVGLQQKHKIEKRHFAQEEANDALTKTLETVVAEKGKEIIAEKNAKIAENDKAIRTLQKKHASAIMETIQRHRRAQDDLIAKPVPEDESFDDPEMSKAALLEALMPLQELERTTLKSQQTREIEKWKQRGQKIVKTINTTVKIQQMRFKEEEKVASVIDSFNNQQDADLKWFDLVHGDRANMLVEDERRLVVSGGDVGGGEQGDGCTSTDGGCTPTEDCPKIIGGWPLS